MSVEEKIYVRCFYKLLFCGITKGKAVVSIQEPHSRFEASALIKRG
jgi:hypothetical protein